MVKNIIIQAGWELKKQYYSIKANCAEEKLDLITESDLLMEQMLLQEPKRWYSGLRHVL